MGTDSNWREKGVCGRGRAGARVGCLEEGRRMVSGLRGAAG